MKEAKCANLENGSGEEPRYKQAEKNRMMKPVMVGGESRRVKSGDGGELTRTEVMVGQC